MQHMSHDLCISRVYVVVLWYPMTPVHIVFSAVLGNRYKLAKDPLQFGIHSLGGVVRMFVIKAWNLFVSTSVVVFRYGTFVGVSNDHEQILAGVWERKSLWKELRRHVPQRPPKGSFQFYAVSTRGTLRDPVGEKTICPGNALGSGSMNY